MAGLRTEFDFTLPKGFVGSDGMLHRDGTMRLATAMRSAGVNPFVREAMAFSTVMRATLSD